MMTTRLIPMIAVIMMIAGGFAGAQDAPASDSVETGQVGDWSKPLDDLAVRMVADRAVYHPGERMRLWTEARNAGQNQFYVRTGGKLHVFTPAGEHMIHAFSKVSVSHANLSAGGSVMQGEWSMRLVKGARYWRLAEEAEGEETPLDMTRPGIYTFWHEHEAKPDWLATMDKQAARRNRPAWTGKIVTPSLKIEIRELRDADKVRELTESQRDDLRMVAAGPDKNDRGELRAATNRLAEDLLLAANVGLADAATALVVEQVSRNNDDLQPSIHGLWQALSNRAAERHFGQQWPPVNLAIRGEYLRPLAEIELKSLKASFEVPPPEPKIAATRPESPPARPGGSIEVLLALCLDKKDEALRKPLAELAAANAKRPDLLSWKPGQGDLALILYHRARLARAWGILQVLDVLQGKTEAEVVAILGQPTSRRQNFIEWYVPSPKHVNPFIRVFLDGGKVQSVSCDVY